MIDKDLALEPNQRQAMAAPPTGVDPQEPDPDPPKTGGLDGDEDAFERALGSRQRRQPPPEEVDEV